MEYDKTIITLFDNNKFSGKGKDVIQLVKNGGQTKALLTKVYKETYLFVFNQKECHYFYTGDKIDLNFDEHFNFYDDYLFCLNIKGVWLFGRKGKIVFDEILFEQIVQKYIEVKELNRNKQRLIFDKNFVVDGIINKVFNEKSYLFLEQTKSHLENLFSTGQRESELEKIVPCSKFIKLVDNNYAGIIYKKNLPNLIAMGFCDKQLNEEIDENKFQCIYKSGEEENELVNGYFLSFRRVGDAEQVFI